MQLLVNGSSLSIAQMGSNFLLVDAPINHPPGEASIVMRVDESESRWKVNLPNVISTSSERIVNAPYATA